MNNTFNENIYNIIETSKNNNHNNIIISGLSIKFAFAMLLNAADGKSKEELIKFLGNNENELNNKTLNYIQNNQENLKIANSFWFSSPNTIKKDFENTIKRYQNADIFVEDFSKSEVVNKVNNWISINTNNLINNIIDNLRGATSLLINTLYFKDEWSKPLDINFTKKDIFNGTKKRNTIDMMKAYSDEYFENDYAKGFSLNYKNSPYKFIAILPNEEGKFDIRKLDLNNFNCKDGKYSVIANFPKLNIDYKTELSDNLKKLHLKSLFKNKNDFNKMLDIPQKVDEIIHKTKFKLDENGTEAAAATIIGMKFGAAYIEEKTEIKLNFNRPFAFMIKDEINNEILFIGKINNL